MIGAHDSVANVTAGPRETSEDRTTPRPPGPGPEPSRAVLLSGNDAIAQAAIDAGVRVAAAYPGTPSTEVLQTLARLDGERALHVEWSTNEKVSLDVALGAAIGGARALAAMKHVGLNVAADTFLTAAYTGARAGLVVVSADDPGMHSSQNEQDNRHFARFAGVPLLEPADSQEAYDFTRLAFALSERFDVPVLVRTTTRVAHARGVVRRAPPEQPIVTGFRREPQKFVMLPANARGRRRALLERLEAIRGEAETTALNRVELRDRRLGIVTSGIAYQYVREVVPDASVLKLGLSFPFPEELVRRFAGEVERLVVVEELEPILEDQIRAAGLDVVGKAWFPRAGELTVEVIARAFEQAGYRAPAAASAPVPMAVAARPPVLCPGCPHIVPFLALRQLDTIVSGDIGCYTLAATEPLSAMDTTVAMGSSIGMAIGLVRSGGAARPVVAVIGDSTFMHGGLPAIADAVYNGTKLTVVILDNGTTAMTGGQGHPAAGTTLRGEPAPTIDLVALCRALGVSWVRVVDPYDIAATRIALGEAIAHPGVAVVITNRPCVEAPAKVRDHPFTVVEPRCTGCQACMNLGCPSIVWTTSWHEGRRRVRIDAGTCTGCTVCAQVCVPAAIVPVAAGSAA
jgi:indolepyruvate ferredoxin oxidoreductase alpha subunit